MTESEGGRSERQGGPEQPSEEDGASVHGARPAAPDWPALIALAVAAGGPIVILSFLVIGERGNFLIQVFGLLFAFIGVITPLLARYRVSKVLRPMKRWQRWCFALGVLVASVAVSFVLYQFARVPAVDVAIPSIRVDGSDELTPTTPATIVFLEPTPDRENLGLRLHLDDYIGSGDCTTSASLTLTPLKGGQEGEAVQVPKPGTATHPPEEVAIPIGGKVQDLRIRVELDSGVGCKLRLVVREAVFYG
jgi:hypothetical protein